MRQLARLLLNMLSVSSAKKFADDERNWEAETPAKAKAFGDRFREIISDPINLLIERDPLAGVVSNGLVKLHTGAVVPISGPDAYCGWFSDILALNRGVHEPLEEFVFQELLRTMPTSPTMLELGAYWGHYSMWMKKARPDARVFMVEPEKANLQVGIGNFKRNGFDGEFINALVGPDHLRVDDFLEERGIEHLDILHADIQGAEVEMLEGCERSFQQKKISYCLVSTHSQELHGRVVGALKSSGFRIEVSSDFAHETTSYDGLVFASNQSATPIFNGFKHFGRETLCGAPAMEILSVLNEYAGSRFAEAVEREPARHNVSA